MASNSEAGGSADYETLMSTSDVELLKRAWRNEKAAPEILQYEGALVDRAKEQIELVEETIEDYVENGIDPLVVSLYQMDLDRTQFLLRSYLRVRLLKIEKFMFHNLKSEEAERRLSEQEKVFATRFGVESVWNIDSVKRYVGYSLHVKSCAQWDRVNPHMNTIIVHGGFELSRKLKTSEEMHLWPSLKLRNSFKSTSQKRFQRMNSGKQNQSNQQKLLNGDKESGSPEISSGGGFAVVCRDAAMVLSCCYCCFCCGACIDDEEI